MTGKEKVLLALQQAGAFGMTADAITGKTGVRQPARRVNDLRNDGHKIEGDYIDRAKGIFRYRLIAEAAPIDTTEPENFDGTLFPDVPPEPINAIYGDAA